MWDDTMALMADGASACVILRFKDFLCLISNKY